jgi:NAD(P)-dependent dehydrogenase (short-subunit alcohol dehydrogenase family)
VHDRRSQILGSVAVVTGGGSGIGRSIVLSLARAGSNCVVADIDRQAAEEVRDEALAFGVKALCVETDVASVRHLSDETQRHLGHVNILVNNAGVTLRPFRARWDSIIEDYTWVIRTNFGGVVNGFLPFAPQMRLQLGIHHIVVTSSMDSLTGYAGHSTYTASKGAIDGFVRTARLELRRKVLVSPPSSPGRSPIFRRAKVAALGPKQHVRIKGASSRGSPTYPIELWTVLRHIFNQSSPTSWVTWLWMPSSTTNPTC